MIKMGQIHERAKIFLRAGHPFIEPRAVPNLPNYVQTSPAPKSPTLRHAIMLARPDSHAKMLIVLLFSPNISHASQQDSTQSHGHRPGNPHPHDWLKAQHRPARAARRCRRAGGLGRGTAVPAGLGRARRHRTRHGRCARHGSGAGAQLFGARGDDDGETGGQIAAGEGGGAGDGVVGAVGPVAVARGERGRDGAGGFGGAVEDAADGIKAVGFWVRLWFWKESEGGKGGRRKKTYPASGMERVIAKVEGPWVMVTGEIRPHPSVSSNGLSEGDALAMAVVIAASCLFFLLMPPVVAAAESPEAQSTT